jgi:SAM-dependent methyltransferase
LVEIGSLKVSRWFAGTRLEEPMPDSSLYRCANCQLKFRSPVETEAVYSRLYDNAATATWHGEAIRADWDIIASYLSEQKPQGASVLDFGCYTGGLLDRLGERYRRYGIEINSAAAAIASQHIDGNVWSSVDDLPVDLEFDVIIATDVVEHVPNPLLLIEQLISKLSVDGVLLVTTGDADNDLWNRFGANWWYCFYPEHLSFLSRAWLEYASSISPLSVARCETFRYSNPGALRSVLDRIFVYWYGCFPSTYLLVGRLLNKLRGRGDITSVPGNGISDDHLFIVLKRADGT